MEEDYFTYKVAGWLIFMLLMLQPAGTYEPLSDALKASANAGSLSYQESAACIDEALPLPAVFALRLRSQHAPQPGTNIQAGCSSFFQNRFPEPQRHISTSDFIRRRSTLCVYRI